MLENNKLIWGILSTTSVCFADVLNLETEHFRVCEVRHGEKVVVKHENFTSSGLECAILYQSKVHEISKDKLLFSSVIGHGTGFNIEKLFIIQAEETGIRTYNISGDEILKQLKKRTKFEVLKNNLKIIIDNKILYKGKINMDAKYYIDYCEECFYFNLDNKLSITATICKKEKDKAIYPDFVGNITFDIDYVIKDSKLEFSLGKPVFKM